jgi:hypothetical protein
MLVFDPEVEQTAGAVVASQVIAAQVVPAVSTLAMYELFTVVPRAVVST